VKPLETFENGWWRTESGVPGRCSGSRAAGGIGIAQRHHTGTPSPLTQADLPNGVPMPGPQRDRDVQRQQDADDEGRGGDRVGQVGRAGERHARDEARQHHELRPEADQPSAQSGGGGVHANTITRSGNEPWCSALAWQFGFSGGT
jgi:hypothetical protein